MNEKIDLEKTYKHLYAPSAKEPEIVEVPPFNFLMLDGCGNPNTTPLYQDTVTTLFQTGLCPQVPYQEIAGHRLRGDAPAGPVVDRR
jgi:hypothetical protein